MAAPNSYNFERLETGDPVSPSKEQHVIFQVQPAGAAARRPHRRRRAGAERADRARNIEKSYAHGTSRTYVLRRINLDIKEGEFVSIMGPSGAGKSTLLHIIGMHDSAWTGEYYFLDQPVHKLGGEGSRAGCTSSTSASSSRAITCWIT